MWNISLSNCQIALGVVAISACFGGCLDAAADGGSDADMVDVAEEALGSGGFKLKNTNTAKCLTVAGGLHATAFLRDCTAQSNSQRWGFDGGYLKHLASGLCLDIVNASQANGAAAQLFNCQGNANQDFRFYPTLTPAGATVTNWYLVVRHSSKCLQPGGAAGDQAVQSNSCLGAWNVEF